MTTPMLPSRGPLLAFALASVIAAPRQAVAQGDPTAPVEVRVLETLEPSTGRRSLHILEALSPAEVRAVQGALRRAGFGEPWRDGLLDPFTRGALQRFQTHRGLAVCACVSLETLVELDLGVRVAETVVLEEFRQPARAANEREGKGGGFQRSPSTSVDYATYYPFGVVYLAPFFYPHGPTPPHASTPRWAGSGAARAGLVGPGFAIDAGMGRVHAGTAVGVSARPPLGPFPRVTPPPNVVRGGG